MAKAKPKKRKSADEHTLLGIRIERYEVRVDTGVNLDLVGSNPLLARDDDPVYTATTDLELYGVSVNPTARAWDDYEVGLMGWRWPRGRAALTLRDVQARDEHGAPKYRRYRGDEIPVYDAPTGLALLNRRPGTRSWYSWIQTSPHVVTDALLVLSTRTAPLYLSVHEHRIGRRRWVQSVSLQTAHPAEE